jgi:hypothetical protein
LAIKAVGDETGCAALQLGNIFAAISASRLTNAIDDRARDKAALA